MAARNALRQCVAVARADVLDRGRDRRFLVVLLASAYLGHLVTVGDLEMALGDNGFRGVHNAAWLGTNMALAGSAAVAVFGFYYTKTAIERDRHGGPRQLIASSPIGTVAYLVGKWLSNLALLAVVLGAMGVSVVLLFALRGTGPFDPVALLAPLALFAFPVAALVAAVALAFEATPVLRGSLGNVLYLVALVAIPVVPAVDPLGGTFIVESMQQAIAAQYPDYTGGGFSFGYIAGEYQRFEWQGLPVTADLLLHRVAYFAVAPVIVVFAAVPFDRLSPDAGFGRSLPWPSRSGEESVSDGDASADPMVTVDHGSRTAVEPEPVTLGTVDAARTFRPVRLLVAELKLALAGRSRLWYAGYVGLFVGGLAAPSGPATRVVLTLAWVWPLFVWSQTGVREYRHGTHELVFTSLHPLAQLLATWAASVVCVGVLVGPAAVRFGLAGDLGVALAMAAGVLMVPSLAAAAGVTTRTGRVFEVGYLLVWYVAIVNQTPALDYGGVTGAPSASAALFAAVAVASMAVAVVGRWRLLR
ncbi:hypothetical protein OB920_19470 [Halobacteria archaeon HArc-gm2]|nr:hypothetical protein [Halobacteria archaeon HArc-gm2]